MRPRQFDDAGFCITCGTPATRVAAVGHKTGYECENPAFFVNTFGEKEFFLPFESPVPTHPPVQLQDGKSPEWTCPHCGGDALWCECRAVVRTPSPFVADGTCEDCGRFNEECDCEDL